MTRDVIAGAWYGDHLPSGVFCATVPKTEDADGYCVTHLRTVRLPPGESFGIGFPRCTDVGGFRFAGQAHDTLTPAAWEWQDGTWRAVAPPCVGVSPVIYDRTGTLLCSDGSVGSQGYRYMDADNLPVSGDATYGPFHGLFEYTALGGDLWIGQGATDGSGVRVVQHEVNSDTGIEYWTLRQLELGDCRFVRANRNGERVALAFTKAPDGVVLMQTTMTELRALPPVVVPPAPEPIGPRSPARPADGTVYDLVRYVVGEPALWPRKGPQHAMAQPIAGHLFHFVKFGNPEAYETWGFDANWLYHLEDASAEPYHFSDPRWFPRRMEIGEAHAFDSGEHEIVFTKRYACNVWRRDPVVRRMWLHAAYERFYWGPDLGTRETIVVAYDPSASRIDSRGHRVGIPGRNLELGYYALGAGSCRWDSFPSTLAYANPGGAMFTDATRQMRSDFYLLGGAALQPALTGCVAQTVPSYPPWDPHPPKDPVKDPPLQQEIDPMIAYAAPVPGFKPGDLVDNHNGTVSVKKPNGKFLCVTPDGAVDERDTPGGAWESFTKGKASLLAERDGGSRGPLVYVLPMVE